MYWGRENIWQGENLDYNFEKVYDCHLEDNKVIVSGSLAGVSRYPWMKYVLEIAVDAKGKIEFRFNGDIRENVFWLPRFGFEAVLPQENAKFSYYGNGPFESYRDMKHAGEIGLYESCAEREYVNYIRPQEHGNHTDAKMLKIGDMCIESDNFEFKVSKYSTKALAAAQHTDELVTDGKTHLRIDYKVSGVGSNSCGPQLEEEYRLSEKKINFTFTIKPNN